MDRLPPRQQRRLPADRTPGRTARRLLRHARQNAGRARARGGRAGRPSGERALRRRRRAVRDGAHRRLQRRPRAVVRRPRRTPPGSRCPRPSRSARCARPRSPTGRPRTSTGSTASSSRRTSPAPPRSRSASRPTCGTRAATDLSGFDAYKARLAERARAFGKPVLLLNGDSHVYTADKPLPGAPNLSRVTVNGSTSCPHEYLRLRIDPSSPDVFSHERVPLPSSAQLCAA